MPGTDISAVVETVTLDCDLAELHRLEEVLQGFCGRAAVSGDICDHLALTIEELFVNSIKHGNCDPLRSAIRIELSADRTSVRVVYSDNGIPFDPLSVPPPDLGNDVGRRPIGGLGIYLIRCLNPEIRYERREGRNYLFISRPIKSESEITGPERGT